MATAYLDSLNAAQRKAVEHDPNIPLQILAGPGSGKTKVLTSRIAHLITVHRIPPRSICAVTFTKKAANEMQERLQKLIGKQQTREVRMGTFHSLCSLYIRKYAVHVGIKDNFTVCDNEEGKKIITTLMKSRKELLKEKEIVLSPANIQSKISGFKAKGVTSEALLEACPPFHPDELNTVKIMDRILSEVFQEYEVILKKNNSLDFDDLLLVGLELFTSYRPSVTWCQHVLVDEFQDTNFTQYGLMRALAIVKCVTIVGDPDQSIYGWRAAEVKNIAKMQRHFAGTEQIFLEQNYRSTSSILKCSLAIVSQDKKRIPKTLHTSHPAGIRPLLRTCDNESHESTLIAMEIKRVMAHMGGALTWGDFAILLRFNALSRSIESALQKEGVPVRMLGGHRFFDRMEIKDVLAYLQLVDNPRYAPAFARSVNVPARGVGEKTLTEINGQADSLGIGALEFLERIYDGEIPDIKPPVRRKTTPFVKVIRSLRAHAASGTMPTDLIRELIGVIGYEDHLRRTEPEWETRWENVQELITFAGDVQKDMLEGHVPEDEETPLRMFLQASLLSSTGDSETEENNKDKVTIATCHAAKGLEWPVIIIPSVEDGTFPFHRSEDVDEERRLLYVACTRAKGLLYMTRCLQRTIAGVAKDRAVSQFLDAVVTAEQNALTTDTLSMFDEDERATICTVLGRPPPSGEEAKARVQAFYASIRNCQPFRNLSTGLPDFRSSPGADVDHATEQVSTFVSVRNMGVPYGKGHDGTTRVRTPATRPMCSRAEVQSTLRTDANRPQPTFGRVKVEPTVRTDFRSPSPPEGVEEQVRALAGNGIWSSFTVYSRQDGLGVKGEEADVKPRMPVASSSTLPQRAPSSSAPASRKLSGGVKREASLVDLVSPPRTRVKQRKLSKQSSIIDISDSLPPSPSLNAKKIALSSYNTAQRTPSVASRTPIIKAEPALRPSVKTEPHAEPKAIDHPRSSPTSLPSDSTTGSSSSGSDVATHKVTRRLGMGRSRPGMGGYSNKKFKPPL